MTIATAGPILAGGIARNNQFTAGIVTTVAIPAGAMVWIVGGSNVADTAEVTIADTAGNSNYVLQSFVSLPGVPGSIVAAAAVVPNAIPLGGTITLTSSIRANWDLNCVYFTGVEGAVFSQDTRISAVANTNPSATVKAQPNMNLFSLLGVIGPSSDGFTQDAAWGTDQKGAIARSNVTVHASGRTAPGNAEELADYSYAPTLGTARRSVIYAASFT